MKKEEFELKVKEVYDAVQSLVDDPNVCYHSSLYGFLFAASMSLDLAVKRVDEYYSLVEVSLNYD